MKNDPPVPQGPKSDAPPPHPVHIVPLSIYLGIFTALLVLTGVTVGVAFIDLGPINNLVAMGIAVFKATLVLLYFMHLRYSSALNRVAVMVAAVSLAIMISFTLSDFFTRPVVNPTGAASLPGTIQTQH